MEKMTITEALSEINLIKKKAEKKKGIVLQHLVKAKHVKDPLESEGGSKQYVSKEIQSISDLTKRFISLKTAIAKANIENAVTIGNKTQSIFDWLTWKRDLSEGTLSFNRSIHSQVKAQLDSNTQRPQVWKDEKEAVHLVELESNVDYATFLKEEQEIQETIERLDGQLSLKNATIVLEI